MIALAWLVCVYCYKGSVMNSYLISSPLELKVKIDYG